MLEFRNRVTDFYKTAKGAKKKAAEFFLLHSNEVVFMTLEQIAAHTGVSPATITRTATEMGYKGFPDLLQAARQQIQRDTAPLERLDHFKVGKGSTAFKESLQIDQQQLAGLAAMNSQKTIQQAVQLLAKAEHVYVFSSRTSYGALSFFYHILNQIRPHVTQLTQVEGMLPDMALDFHENDVLFVADLPRYSRICSLCAAQAQATGCRIIAVTDGPTAPLALNSDVALFVPYESASFFNSGVAAMALYNGLATELNLMLREQSQKRLERHEQILRGFSTLVLQKD